MHCNPKLHKIPLIAQQSKTKDKRREKKKKKAPEPTLKQTKGQGVAHKSLTYLLTAGAFHFLAINKIPLIAKQSKTED